MTTQPNFQPQSDVNHDILSRTHSDAQWQNNDGSLDLPYPKSPHHDVLDLSKSLAEASLDYAESLFQAGLLLNDLEDGQ